MPDRSPLVNHSPLDDVLLQEMLTVPSPAGAEAPLQRVWAAAASPVATRLESDSYGNTWAVREGTDPSAPRVLIEAHADEIGLTVRHIADEGFLHVAPMGGADLDLMRGRRVVVLGRSGPVSGILGNTAMHLRKSDPDARVKWPDLFIDIGASKREEVEALGVRVGSLAVMDDGPFQIGQQLVCGRGIDNRIGGYILIRLLSLLQAAPATPATLYAANCVHEEIGGPGARMTAFRLAPDVAVVLDVTHATDTPGIDQREHGRVLLGGGPTLTHSPANHPLVVSLLEALAVENGIPIQHESASRSTGTDTDDIYPSRGGVPTALVSIPLRYMHSPVETVHWKDVEATSRLLAAFVRALGSDHRFHVDTGASPAQSEGRS